MLFRDLQEYYECYMGNYTLQEPIYIPILTIEELFGDLIRFERNNP